MLYNVNVKYKAPYYNCTNYTDASAHVITARVFLTKIDTCLKDVTHRGGGAVVKAFASQAEGWVFESQLRQTKVVKTGSDSSTAIRTA